MAVSKPPFVTNGWVRWLVVASGPASVRQGGGVGQSTLVSIPSGSIGEFLMAKLGKSDGQTVHFYLAIYNEER